MLVEMVTTKGGVRCRLSYGVGQSDVIRCQIFARWLKGIVSNEVQSSVLKQSIEF